MITLLNVPRYHCFYEAVSAPLLISAHKPFLTEIDPSVSFCTANHTHFNTVKEIDVFSRSRGRVLWWGNPNVRQQHRWSCKCSNGGDNGRGPDDQQESRNSSTIATEERENSMRREPADELSSSPAADEFKSILPDRKAKFDISMAGPLAGGLLSFTMLGVGLLLSRSSEAAADLVQVPSMLFQGSLLLGSLSRAALGYDTLHAATVAIHPLVLAGWCGLTTTAFNLLPVGCLDGGRAMQAAFGKGVLTTLSLITYLLLGLGVLGGPLSLQWGLYILICQRDPEKPCLNDVSEVGTWRQGAFGLMLLLVVLVLLPLWDQLAEELGIGLGSPPI